MYTSSKRQHVNAFASRLSGWFPRLFCEIRIAPGLSPLFVPRLWGRIFAPENMNALHRSSRAEAPSSAANELLRLLSSRGVDK